MNNLIRTTVTLVFAVLSLTLSSCADTDNSESETQTTSAGGAAMGANQSRLRVLFLGNDGENTSHDPVARINEVIPNLSRQGILTDCTGEVIFCGATCLRISSTNISAPPPGKEASP